MQAMTEERRRKWRKLGVSTTLGFVVGALGAAGIIVIEKAGLLGELSESQLIAALVALVYLLMGLAVGVGLAAPRFGEKFLNVEDAQELTEERAMLLPSALGCVLLAAGLAALALSGGDAALPPMAALAIFALTFGIGAWLSARSIRAADELMRQLMRDSAAAGLYVVFVVLGGWAMLAHLGFAAPPAMLDIVTLLYGLTLLACFWVIGRRGMLMR